MAGVGKGLLKREIDFEHETVGEIGKGARDGLRGGETFDSDIRTFIQRFFVGTSFIVTLE